ncbi:MAG: MFS transporter [Clostridiales Family XIII bacterium]|nr:MFS transporter [Clostridiales Family XIII bacterium]
MGAERRAVLFTIFATAFVTTFAASSLNIAIPIIGKEFHIPVAQLSWIITTYMLFTVSLSVPFGRLADITGKRRLFILGIFIFGLMSGVSCITSSFPMLIAFRALQGFGAAMIFATNTAIIADVFPAKERGRMLGLSVAFTYGGLSAGPVIGGMITHYIGWRYTFALGGVVSLIAFAIAAARLPKSLGGPAPDAAKTRGNPLKQMDPGGIFLYIASTVTLMYGLTIFTQNVMSYVLTAAGVTLLVVFVNKEKQADKPIIEIRLFRNINFLLSNLAALFNYGATFALSYLLSIYLQIVKGYGADMSGLILITQPVIQVVFSPLAGRLSDKYSPYRIASIGMGLCTVSLVSFIFTRTDSPLWYIIVNLTLAGLGVALFSSPNTNAIMSCVRPGDYGVASSLTSTMRTMGQIVSLAIITIIMNMALGATPIDEATESGLIFSMHTGFIIFACICAVGVVISTRRGQKPDA